MSKRNGEINEDKDTIISQKTHKGEARNRKYQYQSRNDYTVGWICALAKELTAATAMLDHIHPDLPKPPDDPNTYTLGSINNHEVVITCLPKGRMGSHTAATSVTQMVRSFPSVKVGLIVGIGGGIQSKVRLGDVVISTPVDEYQGVVQWDCDKREEGGVFRRTDSPPSSLLTALTNMESRSRLNGYKILQYLEDMGQKWPSSVLEYTRPSTLKGPGVAPSGSIARQTIGLMLWEMIVAFFKSLLGWRMFAFIVGGPEQAETNSNLRGSRDIRVHHGLIASSDQSSEMPNSARGPTRVLARMFCALRWKLRV